MARAYRVSHSMVQKIWAARGLKPHRVQTFKLSTDPRFEEKLADGVGLYLNPPERAIALSMDEKSQIQALGRTQPSLPMKPGWAGTMTHDGMPPVSWTSERLGPSGPAGKMWCVCRAVVARTQFRREAVELVRRSGESIKEIASDLSVIEQSAGLRACH